MASLLFWVLVGCCVGFVAILILGVHCRHRIIGSKLKKEKQEQEQYVENLEKEINEEA